MEDGRFPLQIFGSLLSSLPDRSQWQPIVDKLLDIMPGWQRGLIVRGACLTLVNSVIHARPTHHLRITYNMQLKQVLANGKKVWWLRPQSGLFDRVDKGCRAVFSAGSDDIQKCPGGLAQSLQAKVSWWLGRSN